MSFLSHSLGGWHFLFRPLIPYKNSSRFILTVSWSVTFPDLFLLPCPSKFWQLLLIYAHFILHLISYHPLPCTPTPYVAFFTWISVNWYTIDCAYLKHIIWCFDIDIYRMEVSSCQLGRIFSCFLQEEYLTDGGVMIKIENGSPLGRNVDFMPFHGQFHILFSYALQPLQILWNGSE